MKSHWITHKGAKILFCDYSNFGMDTQGVRAEMTVVFDLASREPPNSVLTLTDVSGTKGSPEIFGMMKDLASRMTPFTRKRAVVGVTGVQRTFLDMINKISGNKTFTLFDNVEKAMEWLVTK